MSSRRRDGKSAADGVLETIRRCSRSDRPLSVIDLVSHGTLSLELAAWLAARMAEGSSCLVGAEPGRAGKTTVMCALLAMIPAGRNVSLGRSGDDWGAFGRNDCVVAEEISDHRRGAYIWGEDARAFAGIPGRGGTILSTIHADTLAQAREQIAVECGAGEGGLAAFDLFVPIDYRREGGAEVRRIPSVLRRARGEWVSVTGREPPTPREARIAIFLSERLSQGTSSCGELRAKWLASDAVAPERRPRAG